MPDRSTQFATFTVERDIAFPPASVFRAFADLDAKRRWFGDPGGTDTEHALDFRVGGLEHSSGGSPEAGGWFTYDATYQDIVPGERIVYTYAMTIDGNRISASVATIELAPQRRRHAPPPHRAGRVPRRPRHQRRPRARHERADRRARRVARAGDDRSGPMTGGVGAATLDLDRLRSSVRGRVVAPGDETYDADRVIVYGGIDPHPAVIVRVADTADVATVIALARETGLELAVRSGGHSGAAHSTVDGGIVLDVRDLRELDIDVDGRTAWVGSGLTAGEITTALAEHGLAIGFGDTGSVGVAGITLGGGIGYLVRSQGMTIDNLLAVELVTADGEVLTVDEASHPDLFWALRGGGGNFGVATRFRFRLHEVPADRGRACSSSPRPRTRSSRSCAAGTAAPEALSFIANVMTCPPMPFVPEELHGELVIFSLVCWSGPIDEADAALAPIRAAATPITDMLQPQGYPGMYGPEDPDYHPLAVSRTLFMDAVDDADAKVMLEQLKASDAPMRVVQLRPLGGAMARVANDATAFGHRDRAVMANVAAFYAGPEDRTQRPRGSTDLTDALRDGTAAYVNFVSDEGPARVRDAYPDATYDRLAAIKRKYDPDNVFRRNQNVAPAGA